MLELVNRRMNLLEQMKENSAAILFAGVSKIASEDEGLPFVVNRNFYYFTNIEQEESVLVLVKGIAEKRAYLFIQEYNELKEKWTGKRITNEQANKTSSIQNVYSLNNFENILGLILDKDGGQFGKIENVYLDLSKELKIGDGLYTTDYANKLQEKYPNIKIENVYPLVRDLRMIKSSYEIEQMVKAINATNSGIGNLIKNIRVGMKEYELADMFEYYGKVNGRHPLAFNTIIASGKNATCLHYPTQTDTIKEGDMVLFDLGFRNDVYCADISRTYPVNGRFNEIQKAIYSAVLNCNKAVIRYAKPGLTIQDLQDYATEFLKAECIKNKLMSKDDDIRKYYYHNVSHHLGLDTHDTSVRERPLQEGNVITVEPGLYFANYGIGVRIEDDVLIRNGGNEVLSAGVRKEIEDIEQIFKTRGF